MTSASGTPILDGAQPLPPKMRKFGTGALGVSFVVSFVTIATYGAFTGAADRIGVLPSTDSGLQSWEAGLATMAAFLIASVFAVAIHECGHLLAGLVAGYRFVSLDVLGVSVAATERGLRLRRSPTGGSLTLMVPHAGAGRRSRIGFYSGGVVANLATVMIASLASPQEGGALVGLGIWIVGAVSMSMIVNNLLPDRRRHASDGAQIVDALKNSARYRRAVELGRLARKLDDGAFVEAFDDAELDAIVEPNDASLQAMRANVICYSARVERDLERGAVHLEAALRSTRYATPAERTALAVEAAIYRGWYRNDAAGFERWRTLCTPAALGPLATLRLDVVATCLRGEPDRAVGILDRLIPLAERTVPLAQRERVNAILRRWRDQIRTGVPQSNEIGDTS